MAHMALYVNCLGGWNLHLFPWQLGDHLRRVSRRISDFRDLLGSALHANLTQVSVRQNEDMRKISAWVAIVAVPTMVAGLPLQD